MSSSADIIRAIKVAWTGAAGLAAFNGPYRDRKPPDLSVGFPYVVFSSVTNFKQSQTDVSEFWLHRIQFAVFDVTPESVEDHTDTIGGVFDEVALPLDMGAIIGRNREDEIYIELDRDLYQGIVTYNFTRQKPRLNVS